MTVSFHGRRGGRSPSQSKARVDDDAARHRRRGVLVVGLEVGVGLVRVRDVGQHVGRVPADLPVDRLRVGVEQQLCGVEAVPELGRVGPVHAEAVALAGPDAGQVARASCAPSRSRRRCASRCRPRRTGTARRARRARRRARSSSRARPSSRRAGTGRRARLPSSDQCSGQPGQQDLGGGDLRSRFGVRGEHDVAVPLDRQTYGVSGRSCTAARLRRGAPAASAAARRSAPAPRRRACGAARRSSRYSAASSRRRGG